MANSAKDVQLTPEEKQAQEKDRNLWAEVFRMLDCTRTEPDDQLLEALLAGREASADNVKALARMVQTYFELGAKNRILAVCSRFLGPDGAKKLENRPMRRSILDELADEHIARSGEKDEFLEGLRYTART